MNANLLIGWLVGASAGLGLLVTWRRFRTAAPGWLVAHGSVLVVLGAGRLVFPGAEGYAALAVWLPFVLLPAVAQRAVNQLARTGRHRAARRLARAAVLLHPADGWPDVPVHLLAMERLSLGDREGATAVLAPLAGKPGLSGREAALQLFRVEGRWEDLRRWVESRGAGESVLRDPNAASAYARALGELGDVEGMLEVHGTWVERHGALATTRWIAVARLVVAALAGRPDLVRVLARTPEAGLPDTTVAFWLGTALQAAGHPDAAAPILGHLSTSADPLVRAPSRRRVEAPVAPVDPSLLSPAARNLLDGFGTATEELVRHGTVASPPPGPAAVVTLVLIGLNVAVYAGEVSAGAVSDPRRLYELGALVAPPELLEGQWWRVVTSAFLHFNLAHLLMNMLALWYFGRYLERVLGRGRLALTYALAAPLSMTAIAFASGLQAPEPHVIVGASGAVMALLGAILALLARRWRRRRAPVAGRDLAVLSAMLLLQATFDVLTPEVSFVGHASGAAFGFLAGLAMAPPASASPAGAART